MIKVELELIDGEQIELEKMCNHYMGIEAVGGKMFLTNIRVAFKSHSLNFQNHQTDIAYQNIASVEFYTNIIFPNGLKIVLKNGKEEKFVVWGRKKLKQAIDEKVASLGQ